MVGAILALALGNTPLRVAVVEELEPAPYDPAAPHDIRVSALSIASRRICTTLGAWDEILRMRFCPFHRMRVFEDGAETEFVSSDIGEIDLGYIVENRLIQLAAWRPLAACDNVVRICPGRIAGIHARPDGCRVDLEDGRSLRARLLVGADGAQSRVRQAAGIGLTAWDYEQQALVLYVETGYPQEDITWQRFLPHGPQAFLPLPGPHASLVWYETPETVQRLKALPEEALLGELLKAYPPCLGDIRKILARGSFPLRRQHAHRYVRPGIALVGDAAHTIHPLAGQGVNIGLLDAASLAEVLLRAYRSGEDFGSEAVLLRYQRQRRVPNLLMQTTCDLFYRVFGNDLVPMRLMRDAGLLVGNRLRPAKRLAMRYAMGLEGPLPRLAKGYALDA